MSVFSDILQRLGLISGPPVPVVDTLKVWVPLDLTVDGFATTAPPWTYHMDPATRDIASLNGFFGPEKVALNLFGALTAASLLRPDPGDASKFQVSLGLRVAYPASAGRPSQVAGTGKLPLVLINHGNHAHWHPVATGGAYTSVGTTDSFNGYGYLQDALAQNGIVSVSVDHNFAGFTHSLIETRADTIIAALQALSTESATSSSRYHGRLDFANIGLMGHSRGGDAVVRAVKKIRADPALSGQFTVKAVCSLAPTDFTGGDVPANRMFLDVGDVNFYLVVYGALDGDVFGDGANSPAGTGFRHYDRARPQKAMVFLDSCCHNPFNTVWFADGNDSADGRLASAADHQSIAVDYIGDLFRWQLKGENLAQRLDGRTPNRARQHAAQQWMFGQTLLNIDDFENPAANLLGGSRTVTDPGGAATAIEDFASITIGGSTLELHTAHETHVLHVDLTLATPTGTRVLSDDIPAANQDWSGLDTLIFSLSGWFDPTSTASIAAANLPRITVTLIDAANASSVIDFIVYGASLPSRPVFKTVPLPGDVTLMRLETIPVPLSAFAGVDRTRISTLAVEIVPDNDTHVFVDNIHAVKRQ